MKIQKLPPEARAKLECGLVMTDAVQCVLELARNSLDADASRIAVRVDLKNFHIKVTDNGMGIGKDDLELVGERFMTSKCQPFNKCSSSATYGYRGQALSSILEFCRSLTIRTKSENVGPTLVKMFVKSKARQITELKDENCGTGTTIIIEDFMYTMPVRRKRIKEVFEMEEIKTQLQYLALIHYNVCFTLRDENRGIIFLQTPQVSNMLEMISNLFGKTTAKSLKPVKYEENNYKITGYTSEKFSKQTNIQIVYVNRQVIAKGVIHKFINNVMKEYNGCKTLLTDSPAEQILKKLKNSHHTFVIEIKCPRHYYESFTNLRKTNVEFKNWKDILKCIHRGLKNAYKFDCNSLGDSVNHPEDFGGKFGTSVLVNAVKGVPAMRGFHRGEDAKKENRELCKVLFHDNNQNGKLSLIDSKEKKDDYCTIDTLETPIPKNRKAARLENNSAKSHPDTSYNEFYKWLKSSFKTDANAFNVYSEFLQYKSQKTCSENYKSPVLGVKLKEKRISLKESEIPEKKQKTIQYGSGILNKQIRLMTQNSRKIFPNVDLRMKKAVQFSAEMRYNLTEISSFDFRDWKKDEEILTKPRAESEGQKRLKMIQTLSSPESSEIHFTNIIKFRNLPESFHPPPMMEELHTNTWMSHYRENFPRLSSTSQKRFGRLTEKKTEFRDVTLQTSAPEAPQKANVMVQTSQTIPESDSERDLDIPVPDFWNRSTPENHPGSDTFCDLNKIAREQSNSSEFFWQKSKSHSNPECNTQTEPLPYLWTASVSEFDNPVEQEQKTVPLEDIPSPQFCLTERYDFVPKGLSPKFSNSDTVDIPSLDPGERNRIQLTIDDAKNDLLTVKWLDEKTGTCTKPAISDAVVNEMQLNTERKSINFESQILSVSLSYCAIKVHNLLHSFTFTKELLSSTEVLGQLDKKFIVTKMKICSPKNMELISLLDQHAVDERIKLEEIINEYTTSDKFVSTDLSQSLELTFSEFEVRVITNLREKILNFGFVIEPKSQHIVAVSALPSFLLDKRKKENKKELPLKDTLRTVILSIVGEMTRTRGAVTKIPKVLHDAFCSEACHSAIKFNKALEKETMIEMINNLKNCKLPFQCAHGRPSVIPIIDLEDFRSAASFSKIGYWMEDDNIDLQKIKKFHNKRNEDVMESSEEFHNRQYEKNF